MNREQIEKRLYELDIILNQLFDESLEMDDGLAWYESQPELKEAIELEKDLILLLDKSEFDLHEMSQDMNVMSFDDFIEQSMNRTLTDDIGVGKYATDTQESEIYIYPSDIINDKYRKDFTNVVWYSQQ